MRTSKLNSLLAASVLSTLAVAPIYAEEYSYSQSDADNAFDSDRTGNQVFFTLGYHF